MKKLYMILGAALSALITQAQVNDSIQQGPGYGTDVYYSLATGTVKTISNTNWHLAFRIGFQNDAILANYANNSQAPQTVSVYAYPNADTTGWSSFDTTGYASWLQLYNTDSTFELGAFNRTSTGFPDFSWGVYNPITHTVTGDSLYLLKVNNTLKKLWIVNKINGTWTFRLADVDGTNDITRTIASTNYAMRNFAYYDVINDTTWDREPANNTWDLLFTRYGTSDQPGFAAYPVAGVLSNIGVQVAEANKVDVNTISDWDVKDSYSANMNVIGYNWKSFNNSTFQWVIEDSLVYFVKAKDNNIYRLVFSGFTGATNSKTYFTKTNLFTSIAEQHTTLKSLAVYPNPTQGNAQLLLSLEQAGNAQIQLTDLSGKLVYNRQQELSAGFHNLDLEISQIPAGVYVVTATVNGQVLHNRLVIQ